MTVALQTGAKLWRGDLSGHVLPQSAGDADRLYLLAGDTISAWNWTTGKRLWTAPAEYSEERWLLAQGGRVVWLAPDGNGAVVAADGATGRKLWRRTAPRETWVPVTIALGAVYLYGHQAGWGLTAVDPQTGRTLREAHFTKPPPYELVSLTWSPRRHLFYIEGVIVGAGLDTHSLSTERAVQLSKEAVAQSRRLLGRLLNQTTSVWTRRLGPASPS